MCRSPRPTQAPPSVMHASKLGERTPPLARLALLYARSATATQAWVRGGRDSPPGPEDDHLVPFSWFLRDRKHTSAHSLRQYSRLRKPSLNTIVSLRMLSGPSPGAPDPPLMHVATHFLVQFFTFRPPSPSSFCAILSRGFVSGARACGTSLNVSSSEPGGSASIWNKGAAWAGPANARLQTSTWKPSQAAANIPATIEPLEPASRCTLARHGLRIGRKEPLLLAACGSCWQSRGPG
mmetsp:Transcript_3174/g.11470  ORF Transcript_3174/g.11470 Transcript_3174/m.11470 type:complete len:237 (+) Transcript_3174:143-853(+)